MRTLITGIGQVVSGDIARPLLDADSIAIVDGRIEAVGRGLPTDGADVVIDAHGTTVIPGLIDSHAHPVFGDYTPRQRTFDFIESSLHGGVTTMISAGEVHLPGRPKDIVGLKALAIAVNHSYANLRPAGVKVRAGAPILELGMVESDFAEMAAAGVGLIGEIGLGSVKTGADAAPMVAWGRAHGMISTFHTGGPSLAGSSAVAADAVLEANPHIAGHINGGTTSLSEADIARLVAGRDRDRPGARPLRQRADGAGRARPGRRRRCARPGHPGQRRAVRDRGRGPRHPAAHRAPRVAGRGRPGDGRLPGDRQHRPGPRPGHRRHRAPAAPRTCASSMRPVGSVADTALGALANGDLFGISMILIDGVPVIGRSRNTAPAGPRGRGRQGTVRRRRRALMRFGLRLPSFALGEDTASLAEMGAYLRHAEDLGFESAMLIDHLLVAPPAYATTWLEPVSLLSALSGVTRTIRLGTLVLVLPFRDPVAFAKEWATLDLLSGGRSILGVGVGWHEGEFATLRIPFKERGRRMNEMLEAITALWAGDHVTYEGQFYRFEDLSLEPKPVQRPHPPIWIGGGTQPSEKIYGQTVDTVRPVLRRIAKYASTWVPALLGHGRDGRRGLGDHPGGDGRASGAIRAR